MATVMNKVRELFRRNKRSNSTVARLSRYLPAQELEKIALATGDRRRLFGAVASHFSIGEELLLQKICTDLGLEFTKRLPTLDPADLPEPLTIKNLRETGATLKILEGRIVAVICVDPLMVERLLFDAKLLDASLPLQVALWSEIDKVLAAAEAIAEEKVLRAKQLQREESARVTSRILEVMIGEAESYRQSELEIVIDDKAHYSFITHDSQRARGSVDGRVRGMLLEGLEALSETGVHLFRKDSSLIERLELVMQLESWGGVFRLKWKAPWIAALPAPTDEAAIVTETNVPSAVVPFPESVSPVLNGSVLLVDDNSTFAKVLEKFLKKQGLSARHFENGKSALSLLRSNEYRPDIIVCDVHMPHYRGEEFLRDLRADPMLAALPVIILTSDSDPELEIQLIRDGADAFVTKDEDPRLLAAQVERLVRRFKGKLAA